MDEIIRQIVAELKGSWRFRWFAMVSAWIVCLFGWLFVYSLADSYESEATVYVDTSSTLEPLLEQMVIDNDVRSRVELVTTAMRGRPLLERVARETDLHLRAGTREEMDGLINGMRQRMVIENNPQRDPNLYVIRYRDENPLTAQSVVSTLLNMFVEDSLGANRLDSQKAQEFLRDELRKLEVDLERSEQQLADFKKRNVGRMPGEGGDYFQRLQSGIDQLQAIRGAIGLATRKQDALRQQLAGEQPNLDGSLGVDAELEERIDEHQSRLEELQLRFTDLHPDVIALKQSLEQLNARKQEQLDALSGGDGSGIASDNPVFQNIQIELTNVNVEIETLRAQEEAQERQIAELRALIDVLPEVEAELAKLTRDYDVQQAQYQSLLQRLEVAELSESAEQSEEVQFRIIDPPIVPTEAVAPNRPVLILAVLVIGLGAGGALAFLANQITPVFHDAVTMRTVTGIPVLGIVTGLRTAEVRRRRVGEIFSIGIAFAALVAAFSATLIFNEAGVELVRSLL